MAGFPLPTEFTTPVVVYVTSGCGYCARARRLLDSRAIRYTPVDVGGNAEARAWLRRVSGQTTVPQIFICGTSVGGSAELSALDRSGELVERVATCSA